jgi:GrpB-like predicted nucleotidyltransferase (UPF0157 family)
VAARHPSFDERFDPAIVVVAYDPAWIALAAAELARISEALGAVASRLEHVGSTAVPGLDAKPIIDLQVSVADISARAAYADPLERLGYLFAYDPASPDHHFFGRPHARPRTHHVHVGAAGGADERRHLAVRDFLRAREGEASRYAQLKRELGAREPHDRLAYMAGKDAYVSALEARALEWARARARRGST